MADAYITEHTFKQITTSIIIPKDYVFEDELVWELKNGGEISLRNPVIFNNTEVRKLLLYKEICKKPLSIKTYRKVYAYDSLRYVEPERIPCYHFNKDCNALKSNFEYTAFKIPDRFLSYLDGKKTKKRKRNSSICIEKSGVH